MPPRGGKRQNAGRLKGSGKWGQSPTTVMRIPVEKKHAVTQWLDQPLIPLVGGKVAAGFPGAHDDYIEDWLDLNEMLVPNRASTFFMRVQGDSMIDANITDGDILIVDRAKEPTHGDIVIAVIYGEFTVKTLAITNDTIQLNPANKDYEPIKITNENELNIWGVVTHSIAQHRKKL